ncbi:MAG: family 78 glycoside hydrolase catalytic domain [Bacteroidales bacterium]|jgi:alpha-L-rhamnosidase|nr:family 78 glycoside hydrolase catalytic domain [Bacteroidales bacterium]
MKLPTGAYLAALFIILLSGCRGKNNEITVSHLKCENLTDPLALATSSPRFSWKILSGVNGTYQTAFQILVASEEDLLTEKKADIWDSGKIDSDQSILVPFEGKELSPGTICFWKVRIWDDNGKATDWSKTSVFGTGLQEKKDWDASYIGFPGKPGSDVSPLLRKRFRSEKKEGHVMVHINSLGYHEVWINGKKAGDQVLTPAVSQFGRRSLSNTYDITSLVTEGDNDIVIWLGRGWYCEGLPEVIPGGPFAQIQVETVNKGERHTMFVSDASWETRESGYSTLGTWRPGQFGGEVIDGSVILPDLTAKTLDSVVWQPVRTVVIPEHEVTPQMTEPNRVQERIRPLSVSRLDEVSWLVDMGTTLTGWFEIALPDLRPGQKIELNYCDHLDPNGSMVDQGQTDFYIAAGSKDEFFVNKFNYHGFRYVRITGMDREPEKEKMSAYLIHTGFAKAASFGCSDPELNRIHDMLQYTLRCLSLGGYLVDCPQIERLGYGGDGNASTSTAQIMFDLAPLYHNWLQAWADCIRDDGGMPHTAPNPYPAGGGPYWCGFIITASWNTYMSYGDIDFLRRNYPVMQKWLGYAESHSHSGLLERWPDTGYRNWYLGDWAVPDGIDQTDTASVNLVNNCYMAVCYSTMEKISGLLGNENDASLYRKKNDTLREKIHERFFQRTKNIYASGSQIDLTYPLLSGVVPDSLAGKVREQLYKVILEDNSGHIACGLVGVPVFTEWAVRNREPELMYTILGSKDYPGYLFMLENGATTTWEHWNGARSRIHNCYNGIGSWFYQAPGGIQTDPEDPGYKTVLIDPQIPAGLTWTDVSKETPYGLLNVSWRKEEGNLVLELHVPANSRAKIKIPDKSQDYQLNGKTLINESGEVFTESGSYIVKYQLND